MVAHGTLRIAAGVALAAAAGLGALHGRRAHEDRHRERAAKTVDRRRAPPEPARPTDLTDDELRAGEAEATAWLGAGRFREAEARLAALWPRAPEGADRTRLRRHAIRARVAAALSDTVPPSALTNAAQLAELRLEGGRPYLVAVQAESPDRVELELASGVRLTLARARIASLAPLDRAAFDARLQQRIAARLATIDETDPLDRFRLAYFCLEHGLRREGARHILAAVDADEGGLLVAAFCPRSQRPTTEERGLLYTTQAVRRGHGLAARASAAERRLHEAGAAPSGGAGGPPALADAMPTVRAALASYRQSFRGGPGARRALTQAEALFHEARDALMALRQRGEGGAEVDQLIGELQRYLVDCAKVSHLER